MWWHCVDIRPLQIDTGQGSTPIEHNDLDVQFKIVDSAGDDVVEQSAAGVEVRDAENSLGSKTLVAADVDVSGRYFVRTLL